MERRHATVAVIGGGPVGLVCSILLSLQGIDHVLFERQPDTSIHPKAVGLNQRTVEIFRKLGVEDEVLRQAAPPSMSCRTAWYTSLGPEGREICSRYAWGGGPYQEAFERASPCRYALLPQIRLEPILQRRALQLNPNGFFYNHEVEKVVENANHAEVYFHERGSQSPQQQHVIVQYVLGADGGRSLADQLHINMNGESDVLDMVSAHFRAPVSQHRPDPSIFLHWFISPELGGSLKTGYLYHLGPYPMQTTSEQWMFACARLPFEQVHPFTEQDMLQRLHRTLKIPDLQVELLSLSHWHVNAKVAERYRSRGGRVFLVGDAAHRVPPWGALGLNSGIQDADNLVWKLALALEQTDMNLEKLLNTYDKERRPIGERAIGLSPEKNEHENIQAMEQYFDPSDQDKGKGKRQEVDRALDVLDVEFYAHGAEVGWYYDFEHNAEYGDDAHDGHPNPQLNEDGQMELCMYRPSTMPGSQLPHAWLLAGTGSDRISTRVLLEKKKFTLLSMSSIWRKASHSLIRMIVIGSEGDLRDRNGAWADVCKDIMHSGALLVRPDGIIAYRWRDDTMLKQSDVDSEVSKVIRKVLRIDS